MSAQPITQPTWQRLGWHPKAQIVAELDRERIALEAEVRIARQRAERVRREERMRATEARAKRLAIPTDPHAAEHMAVLEHVIATTCKAAECMRESVSAGYCREHG